MFERKIFRDPASEGGGGAPVLSPAQQTENIPMVRENPVIVTPKSYGGSSTYQGWEDPYNDPKLQSQTSPQPSGDAGNQGGTNGQPTPAGQALDPNLSPTATGEPGQAPAEAQKGAWSAADQKYWETKDPAFKDMPYHPAVVKLSGSYRELEGSFTKNQQYLGVVNQTIEDYKSVLQGGDPAEIAKMVEHFGGEVKFDTRGPTEVIKEAEDNYAAVYHALAAVSHELPQEAIGVINKVLGVLHDQKMTKVGGIQRNQEVKAEVQALAKAAGITPQIGNPNERYKAPAAANMTTLEREVSDPHFWDYYDEIKGEFLPGGMYHAQGLTAGKAFGSSVDSARHFMKIAKGLWLQKNMESKVLPQYEKAWMAKQTGNGAIVPPPRGAGAVSAQSANDPSLSKHEREMEEHMRRRGGAGV